MASIMGRTLPLGIPKPWLTCAARNVLTMSSALFMACAPCQHSSYGRSYRISCRSQSVVPSPCPAYLARTPVRCQRHGHVLTIIASHEHRPGTAPSSLASTDQTGADRRASARARARPAIPRRGRVRQWIRGATAVPAAAPHDHDDAPDRGRLVAHVVAVPGFGGALACLQRPPSSLARADLRCALDGGGAGGHRGGPRLPLANARSNRAGAARHSTARPGQRLCLPALELPRRITMPAKPRIAHLASSNATIQNSPPLVTSNKAREKYGLPPLTSPDGGALRFDVLRAQRLAAPVTVYVEQFSAHPLERDAAELYGPPDGYLDGRGTFHTERRGADDRPVYEITLQPEDGVYPLPYMARQADGRPWEEDCAHPMAPEPHARQPFYPDGSRLFEEIDRLGVGEQGIGNLISAHAEIDFYRVVPSSGYTKGLAAKLRTDVGDGDIATEVRGRDFFPYRPYHLGPAPPRPALARIANAVQRVLASGKYAGAIWTQGSPRIEETVYWLNLLVDTTLPICGNASQRPHGQLSKDGDKNIVDSVDYIVSRVWADEAGRNRAGVVLVQDQQVFAARDVQKADARPGGYVATGGA